MASILVEFELSEKMKKLFAFSGHHLCAVKLHHQRLRCSCRSLLASSYLPIPFSSFSLLRGLCVLFPPVWKNRKGLKPTCFKQQLSATAASETEGFSWKKKLFLEYINSTWGSAGKVVRMFLVRDSAFSAKCHEEMGSSLFAILKVSYVCF